MAPEYALWGYLTTKADVFSFGVVALEIVAGKSNMKYRPNENYVCLVDWVRWILIWVFYLKENNYALLLCFESSISCWYWAILKNSLVFGRHLAESRTFSLELTKTHLRAFRCYYNSHVFSQFWLCHLMKWIYCFCFSHCFIIKRQQYLNPKT